MTETDNRLDRDDAADPPDARTLAEQMTAATRSLRAHLSVVREPADEEPAAGS
jgi:hypothetical protein